MDGPKECDLVVPIVKSGAGAPETSRHEQPQISTSKRRHATVYDAVAGKVSYSQGPRAEETVPLPNRPKTIKYSTKEVPLAPDEVLFRRKDAPDRYLEHDIYYAHERELPRGGQGVLPESDLLKAIHSYASSFYSSKIRDRHTPSDMNVAARSMDETALLAVGILLEEAGKEILGRRGDQVFTEGADDAPGSNQGGDEVAREITRIVGHHDVALRRRGPKRRKVADTDDEQSPMTGAQQEKRLN
ncbi:hypothetical protein B0J13DRAFT_306457 [Dactylonectria estremocensis]|uniref:Uncharacterized protein n=1 Tax=Dactylonectria estremocensis TaxID=1079267 RepID=A0A9P9JAW7_9HYPO|nr:hypothetical protein B0J13DRAFT_306457 [Dactylonectria estremocensis]